MDQENVSATLRIAVPAARVFAVLAGPAAHAAIDPTGWAAAAAGRAPLTAAGQIFRMDTYHPGHPGGGCQVASKVVVPDPPHATGWLTGTQHGDGQLESGGWLWRYGLAPPGPPGTEVTLTDDWPAVPQFIRDRGIQFPPFGPAHLTSSLHHLAEQAAPAGNPRP